MSRKRISLRVSFDLPEGVNKDIAIEYVRDAVICHAGSLKPPGVDEEDLDGDPMFDLDRKSVKVSWPAKG